MEIRNKAKRLQVHARNKAEKSKEKLARRKAIAEAEELDPKKREQRLAENQPRTIESTKEIDPTIPDPLDDEVVQDEASDEFAAYFQNPDATPKILVTTSRRASANAYEFASEFVTIFPNAQFVKRGSQFHVKRIVEIAIEREFTDVIIINEDRKTPNGVTMIHLPDGPTATFRLSSIMTNKDISGHGLLNAHSPELILNNFDSRLGHTMGRMFAALFPKVPQFAGRQVCTLHNQRDFIFFRRHRYIFSDGKKNKDGVVEKRCRLQEIGPRFTLKLQSLQKGTFDTKFGEFEWIWRPDTSKRAFAL